MREIAGKIPPDPWHMRQILPLAIPFGEPGENAEDFGVTLCAECRIGIAELRFIESLIYYRRAYAIAIEQYLFKTGWDVDPGILQQRDKVVGFWPDECVLKVDYADVARRDAAFERKQVGRMIIAQHPAFWTFEDPREDGVPCG